MRLHQLLGCHVQRDHLSRTLALLALPDYVLACCSDRQVLNAYFAEQIVPRLDPAEEPAVRRRAKALVAAGRTLPGAKLVKALLADPLTAPFLARSLWSAADGSAVITFKPAARGARIEITGPLRAFHRREIRKALNGILDKMCRSS